MRKLQPYQGVLSFNGKTADTYFDALEGEPGRWITQFGEDKNFFTVEDITGRLTQLDALKSFTDEFKLQIFESNWSAVGTSEDVIKMVLEYVDYSEVAEKHDKVLLGYLKANTKRKQKTLESLTKSFAEAVHAEKDFNVEETVTQLNLLIEKFDDFDAFENKQQQEIDSVVQRLAVFEKMKNNEKIGHNWTNETFWQCFAENGLAGD